MFGDEVLLVLSITETSVAVLSKVERKFACCETPFIVSLVRKFSLAMIGSSWADATRFSIISIMLMAANNNMPLKYILSVFSTIQDDEVNIAIQQLCCWKNENRRIDPAVSQIKMNCIITKKPDDKFVHISMLYFCFLFAQLLTFKTIKIDKSLT